MSNLDICFDFTIGQEGGDTYTDTPGDRGGPTKYGVTLKTLQNYRNDVALTADDVRALTSDGAARIFGAVFFSPMHGDDLPAPIALMAVDFAYNSGQHPASVAMQQVLGCFPDGIIGPKTLGEARFTPIDSFISAYGAARLTYLQGLTGWSQFGRGWDNRVHAAMDAARKLISEA